MRQVLSILFALLAVLIFAYVVARQLRPGDEPGYVVGLFVCVFMACVLSAPPRR